MTVTGEGGLRAELAKVLDYFEEACEYIAENPSEDDRLTAYMRRIDEARAALAAPAPDTLREAVKRIEALMADSFYGEDDAYGPNGLVRKGRVLDVLRGLSDD